MADSDHFHHLHGNNSKVVVVSRGCTSHAKGGTRKSWAILKILQRTTNVYYSYVFTDVFTGTNILASWPALRWEGGYYIPKGLKYISSAFSDTSFCPPPMHASTYSAVTLRIARLSAYKCNFKSKKSSYTISDIEKINFWSGVMFHPLLVTRSPHP